MLSVDNIWAKGRHTPLFDRTTFSVGEGEVIIVQADSQLERTSLALALTGRLPCPAERLAGAKAMMSLAVFR